MATNLEISISELNALRGVSTNASNKHAKGPARCILAISKSVRWGYRLPVLLELTSSTLIWAIAANLIRPLENKANSMGSTTPVFIDLNPNFSLEIFDFFVNQYCSIPQTRIVDLAPCSFAIFFEAIR